MLIGAVSPTVREGAAFRVIKEFLTDILSFKNHLLWVTPNDGNLLFYLLEFWISRNKVCFLVFGQCCGEAIRE